MVTDSGLFLYRAFFAMRKCFRISARHVLIGSASCLLPGVGDWGSVTGNVRKGSVMNSHLSSMTRITAWELPLCLAANQISQRTMGWWLFAMVSRLGNGLFWYILIFALPVFYGAGEVRPMLHLVSVGLVSMVFYKRLKVGTSRPRPYQVERRIQRGSIPLDQYSFPSGHTMHAVAFTMITMNYHPDLFWLVVPFSTLVALSRIVLGLHYPSDVFAGACLGAIVAALSLILVGQLV